MFDSREKIALFIDGANLYAASKTLGFDIDYRKLLKAFQKRGYLLRAYYYTALVEDQEYSSIRPLIDWLDYNGYKVVTKAAKEFTDSTGRRKVKGNMDIELTVDAMQLTDTVDHFVIFSGDGDFRSLVEALQRKGRKVSVVSTLTTQPAMISDELRRQADHFIDLVSLKAEIGRDLSERPQQQRRQDDDLDDDWLLLATFDTRLDAVLLEDLGKIFFDFLQKAAVFSRSSARRSVTARQASGLI